MHLWVAYRMWVDDALGERSDANFHWFACERTLELPNPSPQKRPWSGSDAGDLLACLAEEGLLDDGRGPHTPCDALVAWLSRLLAAFDAASAVRRAALDGDVTSLARACAECSSLDEQLPGGTLGPCGETALHLAASRGHAASVIWLLDHGGTREVATFGGWRPLHFAAQSEQGEEALALLLARGADPNATTTGTSRWSALHIAASHGRLLPLKLLLCTGADPLAVREDGSTALEHARRRLLDCPCRAEQLWPGRAPGAVVKLLEKLTTLTPAEARAFTRRSWGLHVSSELQDAAEARADGLARLRHLLQCYGAYINAMDHDGSTVLHAAAQVGHEEAVALLLRCGSAEAPHAVPVDVDAGNSLGEAALHLCAREGHERCVALLLASGADAQAQTRSGAKPIDLARRRGWHGVVRLLEQHRDAR